MHVYGGYVSPCTARVKGVRESMRKPLAAYG